MSVQESLIKTGWVISNNDRDEVVIQKYDESKRFNSDDEATTFVVKSYFELLSACRFVYNELSGTPRPYMIRLAKQKLKDAIKNAEG